jgi:Leucine-rich repeat (LRR) protein
MAPTIDGILNNMKKSHIVIIVLALVIVGIFLASMLANRHAPDKANTTTTQNSGSSVVVDLSGKGITQVSSAIYNKTDTTKLLLSNNAIQTLPSQMGKMTKITVFKIDHNQLKGSLIGEIRQMSQLKTLDVSYNDMTGMPAELGQLRSLETLNYSYNKITGLPNELAQLSDNLKEFNLTGNPLSAAQVSKLQAALPNTKIIF